MCALLAFGLAVASPARVARAQESSAAAGCSKEFNAQVAEAIWLRDADPQSADEPPAAASDALTLFNLAILIDDLQALRAQSGTASWPRTLSRLSSQELRRRRDAPALDATACEIVRFMLDHYSAERESDGAPLPRRRTAPPPPAPSVPPPRPPEPEPASPARPAVRVASAAATSVPVEPRATPPPPLPAPRAPERAATPPPPLPRQVPEREPDPALTPAPERPRAVETASLPDEDTPAPPPAVPPPDPTPLPPLEIERPALATVEAPVEQTSPELPAPPLPESARADLAALEAQLAAPRYLTLRAIRRNGASRPDDEVWRLRRQTLEARDELVRLLRKLASEPERLGAVKTLLGPQGCTQTERRLRELYVGGPDSEKGDLALELWRRQPDPR